MDIFLTGVQPRMPGFEETPQEDFLRTPEEIHAGGIARQVIEQLERRLENIDALRTAEVQKRIVEEVTELTRPLQGSLEGVDGPADINRIVALVTGMVARTTIPILKIVVLPKKQVTFSFEDFDLSGLATINYRPISDELLIENLRTGARTSLARSTNVQYALRPEDYIVGSLIERDEIAYEDHSDLLYKLAGQIVQRLRSYLATDAEADDVLIAHGRTLADFVFAQMMEHYRETPLGEEDYEVRVTHCFTLLLSQPFSVPKGQPCRPFREPVRPLSDTRRYVFEGFT